MPVNDRRIKDERLKLHLELRTAQAHDKDPPWTFRQLVEVIAVQIGGGLDLPVPGRQGGREVHTSEEDGQEVKCPRCGQTGHHWRECTVICEQCRQKDCPAAYGGKCILEYSTWPTGRLYNALGAPMPIHVQGRLHDFWRSKNPGGAPHSNAPSQAATAGTKRVAMMDQM